MLLARDERTLVTQNSEQMTRKGTFFDFYFVKISQSIQSEEKSTKISLCCDEIWYHWLTILWTDFCSWKSYESLMFIYRNEVFTDATERSTLQASTESVQVRQWTDHATVHSTLCAQWTSSSIQQSALL